jgi:hypothetical protein
MNDAKERASYTVVTILLWIGSGIAINTMITIWIISIHGNSSHAGSVPVAVFAEYRLATEWRSEYVIRELNDRNKTD